METCGGLQPFAKRVEAVYVPHVGHTAVFIYNTHCKPYIMRNKVASCGHPMFYSQKAVHVVMCNNSGVDTQCYFEVACDIACNMHAICASLDTLVIDIMFCILS